MAFLKKRFYPEGVEAPKRMCTDAFILRPLEVGDVELDYEAVMVSRETLRVWAGSSWPADDFTLTDNYQDLELHHLEHLARKSFTFTVVTKEEDRCLGCAYLEPIEKWLRKGIPPSKLLSEIGDYEVLVRFWVRTFSVVNGFEIELFRALEVWLEDEWKFNKVYFRANARHSQQVRLFEGEGLSLRAEINVPGFRGPFYLYGR